MTTNSRAPRGRGSAKQRSSSSVATTPPSDPVLARLAEAEALHQRATRRRDDSSLELFEAAAVAFRDALSGRGSAASRQQGGLVVDGGGVSPRPLSPLKQASALFSLAEVFQGWATRLVERAEATPSDALTRSVEATAAANATTLLAQAVGAFAAASGAAEEIARSGSPSSPAEDEKATVATARHLLSDSIVDAANALTEWGTLLSKAAGWPDEVRERFKFATSAEDTSAGPVELLLQSASSSPEAAAALGLDSIPQKPSDLLSAAGALVSRAVEAYQSAASLPGNEDGDNDDADTRLNLADALVQAAELSDSLEEARRLYDRAFASFGDAVARASSEDGDDLPSLLLNWGVALHSSFTKLHGERKEGGGVEVEASETFSPLRLLEAAESRLRESSSFGRGDTAPLCALGDVLCDRAALAGANKELYERAIEEGYGSALAIDRRCAAASAGKGDALLALSRIAAAGGNASSSVELARAAHASYSHALSEAPRLGGLDERGSVLYNAACAAARSCEGAEGGVEPAGVEEARRRVRALVAGGAVSAVDVLADDDLSCLRDEPWLLDVARAERAVESSEAMRE